MLLCTVSLFLLPWYFVLIICFILGIIRGNKKYRNAFCRDSWQYFHILCIISVQGYTERTYAQQ